MERNITFGRQALEMGLSTGIHSLITSPPVLKPQASLADGLCGHLLRSEVKEERLQLQSTWSE